MIPRWQPVVKTKASVLFQWFVFEGHRQPYFNKSIGLDFGLRNQKIVADEVSIDLNEFSILEKLLEARVKADPQFIDKFINRCYQYSNQLLNTSKEVRGNTLSADLFLRYQNSVLHLMPFLNTILVMDTILKKFITSLFSSELGITKPSNQDELLTKLLIPQKKSLFVQETEMIFKIAVKIQQDTRADVSMDIKQYLENFSWIPVIAYYGNFSTEEEVRQRLIKLVKENPLEKIKQSLAVKKETETNYRRALNSIKHCPRLLNLISLSQELLYLQTYRLDVFFLAYYHSYPMFEQIAKFLNSSPQDIVFHTGPEIVDLIKAKSRLDQNEINRRKECYALILEDDKFTLISGKSARPILGPQTDQTIVRGSVANRGRATGTARLVFSVEDMKKVSTGDIIISTNTIPQLVPAMIKSAGIITDVGGMLSHAAIVSRELGLPCIVGTRNATKIFKDGDLVELNAYE